MQAHYKDGTFGEVEALDPNGLKALLEKGNVKHVEVFNATEEELERRRGPRFTPRKKKRKK